MAYSNLTTFCSALASHGKNFQQYLDGVPTLTLRQAAATDLGSLCDAMTGYSGNTYTNLKALATALAVDNEVQDALSHTVKTTRNGARTEWTQLIADFNALEAAEGLSQGSYGATTTLINAVLAAGMPNDLGQWSDKLTTSQMSNAATALAALGTAAGSMPVTLYEPNPALFLDANVGVVASETGTGTSIGTGTFPSSWTSRDSTGYEFAVFGDPMLEYPSVLNSKAAFHFDGNNDYFRHASPILSGSSGHVFVVCKRNSGGADRHIFGQSDEASTNKYCNCGVNSSNVPQLNQNNGGTADGLNGSTNLGTTAGRLIEYGSNGSSSFMKVDGVAETITVASGSNQGSWFGDVTGADSTVVGCLRRTSAQYFFNGFIALIVAYDASITTTQAAAIRSYLNTHYGL